MCDSRFLLMGTIIYMDLASRQFSRYLHVIQQLNFVLFKMQELLQVLFNLSLYELPIYRFNNEITCNI